MFITLELNTNKKAVDVLVNTTSPTLDLANGLVSKSILTSAGDEILAECREKYPNGISLNSIAVTSSGRLRNQFKHVFHVTCGLFTNNEESGRSLAVILKNCMHTLSKMNLKRIALPAIGTGTLKFPADLVAKVSLQTVVDFVRLQNSTNKFQVNFVIYEQDLAVLKVNLFSCIVRHREKYGTRNEFCDENRL